MKVLSAGLVGVSLLSLASAQNSAKWWKKPLVNSIALEAHIKLRDLLHGSQQLENFAYQWPDRNRVFGSPAHDATVNYLIKELEETGYYDVYKQPQVHLWTKGDQNLTVDGKAIEAQAMTYSPSGNFEAELSLVANLGCDATDYASDIAGKIALIKRGTCSFAEKSILAASANAVAAIVYNNAAEGVMGGTLGGPSNPAEPYVPIVGISLADASSIVDQLASGPVAAKLNVLTEMENRTTYNVIAQTKGGDPNNVVMLGAHTDSVEAGPGINDDGSGTISNLVIAKALSKFSVKNAVRFGFWTAEEFGLLGSEFYVANLNETERAKIRLYLNFDMIASPNYAYMVYDGDGDTFNQTGPAGSAEIEHLFQHYFAVRGLKTIATEFDGRSDYAAFIENGIPAGGLFTGAEGIKTEDEAAVFGGEAGVAYDANYHAVGDNMTNLNPTAFLVNSRATAYAVAKYAVNLDSIPSRIATAQRRHVSYRRDTPVHKHTHGGCAKSRVSS
ncbi:Leucyl aminopeptidase yscIV [Monascus purpureus]|uniref:Peptide hydrolase n=1 Tax=Monascus purpureus TaxID=5098 RepID=A0A507QUS8_MONPU|nr:Leucyl aminopeptidase yscIV [Monascus purpureus]BDD57598.1 Leucyl aminopeptidase yscIV [Monascus purpureus]